MEIKQKGHYMLSELSIKQIIEEKKKLEEDIEKLFENFQKKTNTELRAVSMCNWGNGHKTIKIDIDIGI